MGFTMSPPKPVSIPDSRTATYVQNLRPVGKHLIDIFTDF